MQNSNTKQKQTPTKERTLRRDVKKLVQYTRSISKQPKVNNTIKIPRKETGINIEKIITNDNLDKGVLKKPTSKVKGKKNNVCFEVCEQDINSQDIDLFTLQNVDSSLKKVHSKKKTDTKLEFSLQN